MSLCINMYRCHSPELYEYTHSSVGEWLQQVIIHPNAMGAFIVKAYAKCCNPHPIKPCKHVVLQYEMVGRTRKQSPPKHTLHVLHLFHCAVVVLSGLLRD